MKMLQKRVFEGLTLCLGGLTISALVASAALAQEDQKGRLNRFVGCLGDITNDGVVDRKDIEAAGSLSVADDSLDINRDGVISSRDRRAIAGLRGLCAASADFNADGTVDGYDLGALLGAFGPVSEATLPYDLIADGEINASDTAAVEEAWGKLLVFSPMRLDLNRDGRITNCDAMMANPLYGTSSGRADANKDGVRDFDDYNLVLGFLDAKQKIKPQPYQRACRRGR